MVDNAELKIGTSDDFKLYHQSSDSSAVIKNVNDTGFLRILSGDSDSSGILLKNRDDDVTYLRAKNEAGVELFYADAKKAETVTGGFTITGTCTATSYAGDGSSLTGVAAASADGCMYKNTLTISNAHTIVATEGAHSVGPISLSATVNVNGRWVIS